MEQARRALEDLGWIGWQPPTVFATFRELFGFDPRPMQQAVVELAEQLQEPSLVIIEAPTGEGKTEAALYLADHWSRVCQQRGLYVAMPTMATSNQMFGRVTTVLGQRYPTELVNVHLVHSQALWRDDMQALRLDTADERQGGTVAAMAWFLPRKRTLLAPFGVGTVDQALLSVLQARHFFVRLFGLSHKTVIFDEVHAYDTYMSTIFQRLLGWLRAVGTSVVILSATLPAQTRRELLQAYTGDPDAPYPQVSYPAISWAAKGRVRVLPLETPAQRTVTLEWAKREVDSMAERLADELREGGCAAVICNTVKRSQEVYSALKTAGLVPEEDLMKRLCGRWTCQKCQAVYHETASPPKTPNKCDKCDGDLYQRPDDNEQTIKERLKVYFAQTTPLLDYYEKDAKLIRVDGRSGIEEVAGQILAALG